MTQNDDIYNAASVQQPEKRREPLGEIFTRHFLLLATINLCMFFGFQMLNIGLPVYMAQLGPINTCSPMVIFTSGLISNHFLNSSFRVAFMISSLIFGKELCNSMMMLL